MSTGAGNPAPAKENTMFDLDNVVAEEAVENDLEEVGE
jgi:hypothetical protein